jgi:hydroxymethylbilane synthase
VVLAAAGLSRLGLDDQITQRLSMAVMLPAPAQGALAVECRADDAGTLDALRPLGHPPTWAAVMAERAFLQGLSSGCSAPVAAYAVEGSQAREPTLQLQGLVASLDGRQEVRISGAGSPDDPEQLGSRLAREALKQGASEILEAIL